MAPGPTRVRLVAESLCVQGRRMATVPKCRFDLEVAGGIFVDAPCVIGFSRSVKYSDMWPSIHLVCPNFHEPPMTPLNQS